MVFAIMSLMNSYNLCDYFPPLIILIMLPMSIICSVATVSGLDEATLLHGSVLEHILHNSGDIKYPIKVMFFGIPVLHMG